MENNKWYKGMSFYQIWPRSFMDGNGDGIGDLYGIYEKLDYIKSLNVDGIWFSPLYVSPNADYGYDIADYMNISSEFGDLEIFKKVLDGAHERGLKVIMDLVVNHTSDEHEWFKKSIEDPTGPYHDYYFWRKGKDGKAPNNWDSIFEGKAWEYNEQLDEYYLHLFAKKQPDLNMDNPSVREEVKKIMRFWLDMGIDGFREDVITFISKPKDLPDDYLYPIYKGFRFYSSGPKIHEYLQEFKEVLDEYDCFTIGEAPMMTPKLALSFIGKDSKQELDMMFNFEHMEADCFKVDYMPLPFSLRKLKRAFTRWQHKLNGKAWNTLYLENHDHPRVINRYGSLKYHTESGKMLAVSYLFQQGMPFVYQGQEIGMTNIHLDTIDESVDVYAHNEYRKKKNESEEKKMQLINRATRDSARTPMQWTNEVNAGFTTGKPWFKVNSNYPTINVETEDNNPNSLLNFYRKALKFRKNSEVSIWGDYLEHYAYDNYVYCYERNYKDERLLVVCYFTDKARVFKAPSGFDLSKGELVLSNYEDNNIENNGFTSKPYETRVYLFKEVK